MPESAEFTVNPEDLGKTIHAQSWDQLATVYETLLPNQSGVFSTQEAVLVVNEDTLSLLRQVDFTVGNVSSIANRCFSKSLPDTGAETLGDELIVRVGALANKINERFMPETITIVVAFPFSGGVIAPQSQANARFQYSDNGQLQHIDIAYSASVGDSFANPDFFAKFVGALGMHLLER